jgi:hypothetical protein
MAARQLANHGYRLRIGRRVHCDGHFMKLH